MKPTRMPLPNTDHDNAGITEKPISKPSAASGSTHRTYEECAATNSCSNTTSAAEGNALNQFETRCFILLFDCICPVDSTRVSFEQQCWCTEGNLSMQPLFLNRRFAAKYIRETFHVRCSEKRLTKLAAKGDGPPYWDDGLTCWYTTATIRAWICGELPEALIGKGRPLPTYDIN
jgi:hypothetical protein